MKKTLAAISLVLVLLFSLTACSMYSDLSAVIKKDGSGTLTVTSGFDEEFINGYSEAGYEMDVSAFEKIEYNGTTFYVVSSEIPFSSYDDLTKLLTDAEYYNEKLGEDSEEVASAPFSSFSISKSGMKGVMQVDTSGDLGGYSMEELGIDMVVNYRFTFSSKIKEATGVVSEDGYTVVFDAVNGPSEISVTLESFPLTTVLIAGGFVLIIAAIVLVVLSSVNKKKIDYSATENEETNAIEASDISDNIDALQQEVSSEQTTDESNQ